MHVHIQPWLEARNWDDMLAKEKLDGDFDRGPEESNVAECKAPETDGIAVCFGDGCELDWIQYSTAQ